MTEAERLQKIVETQEKELRRLRKLLGITRLACAEYSSDGKALSIVVTCIGVDEYHFIELAKAELTRIAEALAGDIKMKTDGQIKDGITGEPLEGGVSPT